MQDEFAIFGDRGERKEAVCTFCGARMSIEGLAPLQRILCPACDKEQIVPTTLGKYELVRFLGEGAMGRVYAAKDQGLNREVAVKILKSDFAETPKMWSLLEREAKAAGSLSHRNLVHLFNFGKVNGRPYLVMEMVQMGSVEDQFEEKGPLPESQLVKIAIDVMSGLLAASKIELLHGDIKPANIMLTEKGVAKVTDFGLARFRDDKTRVERWGTPYYIAPEKSQQLQEDFRSDMYSLGATLFHLATGTPPFMGKNVEKVIEKSIRGNTPHLKHCKSEITKPFSDVIHKMMRREPDDRFWSYEKAISCMENIHKGVYHPRDIRNPKRESIWNRLKRF